jgi:signal transduction histidine kinase
MMNLTLEQRVNDRTAELAEVNAELEAFANTVAHDLRAPLRAMEGFAIALVDDYGDRLDANGCEYIQHIIESAKQMDTLTTDLLAYSRLGRTNLRVEKIGLKTVTDLALKQLNQEILRRNAEVRVDGGFPFLTGHKTTLVQIVANLISNGIKFVEPGVNPVIRISTEEKADGRVRLWVEDNGIGIDPEMHESIFHVFERLHGVESYPGTGIGLAIVARATERLGGCCGVESQRGSGSRFWIEFPGLSEQPLEV